MCNINFSLTSCCFFVGIFFRSELRRVCDIMTSPSSTLRLESRPSFVPRSKAVLTVCSCCWMPVPIKMPQTMCVDCCRRVLLLAVCSTIQGVLLTSPASPTFTFALLQPQCNLNSFISGSSFHISVFSHVFLADLQILLCDVMMILCSVAVWRRR